MNSAEESEMIRGAVAKTFRDAGMAWPPTEEGPVPLGRLIATFPVVHEEVDGLNRASASATLLKWGVRWTEIPADDPALAGFIYARESDKGRMGYVFVRRGDILSRRRFTAAHELGHFRLHLGPILEREPLGAVEVDRIDGIEEYGQVNLSVMERQANRFAAELLMPEATCRALYDRYARKYGKVDRYLVYHMASDLLVSREAIAWRLAKLDLIEEPKWLAKDEEKSKSQTEAD